MLSAQTENTSKFVKPIKNEDGYYVSKLEKPLTITLPQMDIYSNGKNEKDEYEIRYSLDINDTRFKQLIEELYFLDELAINTASKNSKNWFGQQISKEVLENLYNTPYDDEDNNLYIKLSILDENLLPKFNYEHHSIVEITALEFYRNSFKYVISVKDVVINEENVDEEKNCLNFNELIETNTNSIVEEEDTNKSSTNNIEDFRTQFVDSVSKTTENIIDENATQILDNTSILSKQEVESIIVDKRNESRRCFLNAERATRAANNLKQKAIETAEQLKQYEKMLENFN